VNFVPRSPCRVQQGTRAQTGVIAPRQHAAGKLTARGAHRAALRSRARFDEIDKLVTHRCRDFGMEKQRSRATASSPATAASTAASVYAFAQDFTVFGGSLSETRTPRRS
jgi:propionyl-CoA carboxylase beta chain